MGLEIFNAGGTEVTVRKTQTGFDYKEKGGDIWRPMTLDSGEPPETVPHELRVVEVTETYNMLEEDFYNTLIVMKPTAAMSLYVPYFSTLAAGAVATLVLFGADDTNLVTIEGNGELLVIGAGGATTMTERGAVASLIYLGEGTYILGGRTL